MLRIRLTRVGKTHSPHYRVVVADQRAPIQGKFIEILGHYHPADAGKDFVVNADSVKAWMCKGAQPTDTVWNLLCHHGVLPKGDKRNIVYGKAKPAAEAAAEKLTPVAHAAAESVATESIEAAQSPETEAAAPTEVAEAAEAETTPKVDEVAEDPKPSDQAETKAQIPAADQSVVEEDAV